MGGILCWLVATVIGTYQLVIFVWVILSWLVLFQVVNVRNDFVRMVGRFTGALVEPALRPIGRMIPSIGGIDLSPFVLVIGLELIKRVLCHLFVTYLPL